MVNYVDTFRWILFILCLLLGPVLVGQLCMQGLTFRLIRSSFCCQIGFISTCVLVLKGPVWNRDLAKEEAGEDQTCEVIENIKQILGVSALLFFLFAHM